MEWLHELFSIIGTELISAIIGLLVGGAGGGAIGYRMAIKNSGECKYKWEVISRFKKQEMVLINFK